MVLIGSDLLREVPVVSDPFRTVPIGSETSAERSVLLQRTVRIAIQGKNLINILTLIELVFEFDFKTFSKCVPLGKQ